MECRVLPPFSIEVSGDFKSPHELLISFDEFMQWRFVLYEVVWDSMAVGAFVPNTLRLKYFADCAQSHLFWNPLKHKSRKQKAAAVPEPWPGLDDDDLSDAMDDINIMDSSGEGR